MERSTFLVSRYNDEKLTEAFINFFFFCRKSECLGILGLVFIVLPMSVTCIVMLTTAGDGIFKGEIYFYGTLIPSMMELKS